MSKIFTPTNQIRLTNVAIVRLKKGGKRFEIACYKNKVLSWRSNAEKDINEVLQTHTVFTNVSKGQAAKKDELIKVFGKMDETEICKEILTKGELQVSEKERQSALESQLKEIVNSVAAMCVDPTTRQPIPSTIIEKLLRDAHFSVKANKNIKQQTLEAIKMLREKEVPIERSNMKIRISYPAKEAGGKMRDALVKMALSVENEKWEDGTETLWMNIRPGSVRTIDDYARTETRGKCILELLDMKETTDVDEEVDNLNVI